MFLNKKAAVISAAQPDQAPNASACPTKSKPRPQNQPNTKQVGDSGEATALHYLQAAGLKLVQRNYRTPGRGGGEIDLIVRDKDGTLVFVEVRRRANARFGGAAASISMTKQRRIVFAARHYLMRLTTLPPCRFDVVIVEDNQINPVKWLKAAFDAA